MPGSNNFVQFDTTQQNIAADAVYIGSTIQQNGVPLAGIADPLAHNKMFYQWSTFITAMAQVFADLGYAVADTDVNALKAVLANTIAVNQAGGISAKNQRIVNLAAGVDPNDALNVGQFPSSLAQNGWKKFHDGSIFQWGRITVPGGTNTLWVNYPIPFPHNVWSVNATPGQGFFAGQAGVPTLVGFEAGCYPGLTGAPLTGPATMFWQAIGN